MFSWRRKNNGEGIRLELDEELRRIIAYYMDSRKMDDVVEAIRELVRKGYNYWLLESKYKDRVDSPLVWDRGLQVMKIESAFLYYRMRVREVIEELRNAILILSGVLADLESCYKTCKPRNIDLERIKGYRRELSRYMDDYIKPLKEELEIANEIDVEELLENVERLLAKYRSRSG